MRNLFRWTWWNVSMLESVGFRNCVLRLVTKGNLMDLPCLFRLLCCCFLNCGLWFGECVGVVGSSGWALLVWVCRLVSSRLCSIYMSMCCVWICGRRYGQVHLCFLPSLFVSLDSCVSLDSRKEQFACATRLRMNVPVLVLMKEAVQDNRMARIMTIDAR